MDQTTDILSVMVVDLAAAPIPHALVIMEPVSDESLRGLPGNQPPHEDLGCPEELGEFLSVEHDDGPFLDLCDQLPVFLACPPSIRPVSPVGSVRFDECRDRSAAVLGGIPNLAGPPCVTHHLDQQPSVAQCLGKGIL
jgi:hypothetical protein